MPAAYLEVEEVLEICRAGAPQGCLEALITLGDRPEDRWRQAREWLDARGYDSTPAYVRAVCVAVLEETGLLPHVNAGVTSWQELLALKPVSPSMGTMLETTSRRLFTEPGAAHHGSPDKDPAVRLRQLTDAGRAQVPWTTGLLVGIGETRAERVDTVLAIRRAAREHGHVQEVLVQGFHPKPDTAMRTAPRVDLEDYLATVAVTRLLVGPRARVQAPPNLVGDALERVLAAGVDDWGGVSPLTPDHVNPEQPWPHLDDLRARTAGAGFVLRARLTAHPEYVRAGEPWLDPRVAGHVAALADPATGPGARGRPDRPAVRGRSRTRWPPAAPAARTWRRPSTPRAAAPRCAPTSTSPTAPGRPSPSTPPGWRCPTTPACSSSTTAGTT